MEDKKWWSPQEETDYRKSIRAEILKSFAKAEKILKPNVEEMFTDVTKGEMSWNLVEQREEVRRLIKNYPKEYSTTGYAQ